MSSLGPGSLLFAVFFLLHILIDGELPRNLASCRDIRPRFGQHFEIPFLYSSPTWHTKIQFLSYPVTRWLTLCQISPLLHENHYSLLPLFFLLKKRNQYFSRMHIHNRPRWPEPRRHQIGFSISFLFPPRRHICQSLAFPSPTHAAIVGVRWGAGNTNDCPSTKALGKPEMACD